MPHKKDHFDKYTFQRIQNNLTEDDLKNKFRPRGSDAFKKSLSQEALQNAFIKGGDKQLPYLSSRFQFEDRENLDGNYGFLDRNTLNIKEYERDAKKVSKIGEELHNALASASQSDFGEQELSKAIYDAKDKYRLQKGMAGTMRVKTDPKTGGFITDDPRYMAAKMIDNYNQARKRAVDAQDASEYYRDFFESKAEEAERMKIDPYNTTNKIGQFEIKNPFDPKYGS